MPPRLPAAVLLILALALGLATPALAAPKWKLLGTATARFQLERDEISVGADEGLFDALQLRVRGANLTLHSAHVVYASGVPDKLEVRQHFEKDGQTRIIDLPGRGRLIRKVVLFYQSKPQGKLRPATVAVWGRQP
jgi:hypothetical protein